MFIDCYDSYRTPRIRMTNATTPEKATSAVDDFLTLHADDIIEVCLAPHSIQLLAVQNNAALSIRRGDYFERILRHLQPYLAQGVQNDPRRHCWIIGVHVPTDHNAAASAA